MLSDNTPTFLREGAFVWNRLGYSFSKILKADAASPASNKSESPWTHVIGVLQQAQRGDNRSVASLASLIKPDVSPLVLRACVDLLGDAGLGKDLQSLSTWMQNGPDYLRVEAARGARGAGVLHLIPAMLEAWHKTSRQADRDAVSNEISKLLDEPQAPDCFSPECSEPEYVQLVQSRVDSLKAQLGGDHAAVWNGQPFGVNRIAQRMRHLLTEDQETPHLHGVWFIDLRHKFEAATGIDCTAFYRNGQFQPLHALTIVEKFLDGGDAANYEDGVRYFFGHRVPD